jgi:hypothetical protein
MPNGATSPRSRITEGDADAQAATKKYQSRAPIIATMKSECTPPMTLGNAAKTELRLFVWCRGCGSG